jgi:hypothetical protein
MPIVTASVRLIDATWTLAVWAEIPSRASATSGGPGT